MTRSLRSYLVLLVLLLVAAAPGRADLKSFMAKPEPVYTWEKRGTETRDGVTITDLHMVSQTWQGQPWTHRIQVFRPEKLDYPDLCLLYNTGGSGSAENTANGIRLAKSTGATYAILFNIPNQPLYGKTEDALIFYTWQKYMETGDESWPLHFPMAKAALKAMDSIQAWAGKDGLKSIDRFIINGASKRGWTTWIAGASQDPRIKAIAPMVIDILNVVKQMKHMKSEWGYFSEQIGDYNPALMLAVMESPPGQKLLKLEDPINYVDQLTMPKLLILGTNDRYWTQDALNLYWDDLKGPKWVLYAPNSGHGLNDRERVYNTLTAFTRMIGSGKKWPEMKWNYADTADGARLTLESTTRPKAVRLFSASGPKKDLRDAKWSFEEVKSGGRRTVLQAKKPETGFRAVYGEAVYEIDGRPFTLSTQIKILGAGQ
jgi:PhoPQ-activated pathogenicity-related protein